MKHYLILIATLTGLTILTACGGEAANSAAAGQLRQLVSPECQANPFEQSCIEEFAVLRSTIIGSCRDNPTADGCADASDFVCMITEDNPNGNPFDPLCDTKDKDVVAARAEVVNDCIADESDTTSTICHVAVVAVCDDNAFEEICDTELDYVAKRAEVINECQSDGGCDGEQMTQICTDNPYNTLCFEDNTFNRNRAFILATCGTDSESEHCPEAIKPVCTDDPFDSRCDNGQGYITARGKITKTCVEEGNCQPDLLAKICEYNPYNDALCSEEVAGSIYNLARVRVKNSCRTADRHPLCPELVLENCTNNPFDTLCDADDTYTEARNMVIDSCRTDDTGANCDDAIAYVCIDDSGVLFTDMLCGGDDYNTKRDDIIKTCDTETKHAVCLVAVAVTCTDNPFGALCRTDETRETYELARIKTIAACRNVSRDGKNCADALAQVCAGDAIFTDVLCNGDDYNQARATECANGSNRAQCMASIEVVCNGDVFNSVCTNDVYVEERKTICRDEASDDLSNDKCKGSVVAICDDNPFDADICYDYASDNYTDDNGALDFEGARDAAVGVCEGDSSGELCADATLFVCATNPYNTLCYDTEHAMAGDYMNARDMAITDCRTTDSGALCADAIMQACMADAFDDLCADASYIPAKINACIDEVNAGTAGTKCDDIADTVSNGCIADPFASECVGGSFNDYVSNAQAKRFNYCRNLADDTARGADTLCAGYVTCDVASPAVFCGDNFDATTRATCGTTPFDTVCDGGAYESARIAFCSVIGQAFDANCLGEYAQASAIMQFCTANPFDANCTDMAYDDARAQKCEEGFADDTCINTPRLGLSAPVVRKIPGQNQGDPETDAPNFVDGSVSVTLTAGAVVAPTGSSLGALNVISRRGGGGTVADPNENPDGFAIFTLIRDGSNPQADRTSWHAAILPTTNLGAPLTIATTTAIWPGHFSFSGLSDGAETATEFQIDFETGTIDFALTSVNGITGIPDENSITQVETARGGVALDVSFVTDNPDGLLTGTATIGGDELDIKGLIGAEGAVAVFAGFGKSGGFTASNPLHESYVVSTSDGAPVEEEEEEEEVTIPPREAYVDAAPLEVNYADWEGIGDYAPADKPTLTNPANEFLQGLASGLDTTGTQASTNDVSRPILYTLDFASATYDQVALGGDERDGVAVFGGTNANGTRFHYAGIFSGTDLGAPLTATTTTNVTWNGHFITTGTVNIRKDFELNVEYGDAGGRITAFVPVLLAPSGGNDPYFLMDASFTANGIIAPESGNFRYDTFVGNDRTAPRGGVDLVGGRLAGIIGEDGALGVFHSVDGGDVSWAGGFVAAPAAPTGVPATPTDVPTTPTTPTVPDAPTEACTSDATTDACKVKYTDWSSSLSGVLPVTAVAGIDEVFQYLRGQSWGFNLAGIRETSANDSAAITASDRIHVEFNDDSTFNGNPLRTRTDLAELSRPAKGGVAFVRGWVGDSGVASTDRHQYFATVLSHTDLGRPVVGRAGALANYNGRFVAIDSNPVDKDFSLTIRFGGNNGGGRLAAFVKANDAEDNNEHFKIDGVFDNQGVITPIDGNIIFASFTDNDSIQPIDAGKISGTLTGLIGEHGAVGVFYGGTPSDAAGMAGGFVAVPERLALDQPSVDYDIWLSGVSPNVPTAPSHGSKILRAPNQHGLNTSGVSVISSGGLSLQWGRYHRSTHGGTALGGDPFDSVGFFSGRIGNSPIYYYAGVLAGTDLGAPLTNPAGASATFYGQINVLRGTEVAFGDIDLAVNFTAMGAGTVKGSFVGFDKTYYINGYFNDLGVVSGSLTKPEYHVVEKNRCAGSSGFRGRCQREYYYETELKTSDASTLSGLIGSEGVIAGFAGANYGGGVVAVPKRPALPGTAAVITYRTWLATGVGIAAPTNPISRLDGNGVSLDNNQFLRIPIGRDSFDWVEFDGNLEEGGNTTIRRQITADLSVLPVADTGLVGGITYFHGIRDFDPAYGNNEYDTTGARRVRYAGIHPDTNLGDALPRAASYNGHAVGIWRGYFTAIQSTRQKEGAVIQGSTSTGRNGSAIPGTLLGFAVNYNAQTFEFWEESKWAVPRYDLKGKYENNGVMTGTVNSLVDGYGPANITGIIGRKGAVGVFISEEDSSGTVGGFIACPTIDHANRAEGDCIALTN